MIRAINTDENAPVIEVFELTDPVECEKARQLKEEIAARNASLRRAVAQNGQFVKALKTLAGKDVSGPSLVFREVSGDPPFSYSATGSG